VFQEHGSDNASLRLTEPRQVKLAKKTSDDVVVVDTLSRRQNAGLSMFLKHAFVPNSLSRAVSSAWANFTCRGSVNRSEALSERYQSGTFRSAVVGGDNRQNVDKNILGLTGGIAGVTSNS
jgi:hypothetical protein